MVPLKFERDIFGKLLAIALNNKIDLEECFSYPLSPLPPALCHNTGEMMKTEKSALAKKLRSLDNSSPPSSPDVWIIDGFYFLHSLVNQTIPDTFHKLSEIILQKICNISVQEIHLVFDRYLSPSIKDKEREKRQEEEIPFEITGPLQRPPSDFTKKLKNRKFKEAIVSYLAINWNNDEFGAIIGGKKIYLTLNEKCYSFVRNDQKVEKKEELNFECYHEEADTRVIFHAAQLQNQREIVIYASDTDILIIALANIHKLEEKNIYLVSRGAPGQRYDMNCINCTKLSNILGQTLCRALPAFHAFTGCDYTASFYRQGKVKPFNLLKKDKHFQNAFENLNEQFNLSDKQTTNAIEEFTVSMYGIKHCQSVNSARLLLFQKSFATSHNTKHFLNKVKTYNSNTIPPCWKTIKQKILRTTYIASMWLNATQKHCVKLSATEYGWTLNNGQYEPLWFDGEPTPLHVDDIVINSEDEGSDNFTSDDDENDYLSS
ncbi:uncharacterized protein LOC134666051 [Cydia fagiglandana]|uniref:uncharacterized protein LOC134666051 n=1 Tax=Cydia fagiglandana TaxID=1458189 RepID=UPI002FEE49CD